ncbi:MAG TPA: trypsin-like peptidase domain-containing protein [Gemmatimonadales bacterium]|nr:trypsin-like peptidase domain-containing protein [Gemmatimonadales bacterium]
MTVSFVSDAAARLIPSVVAIVDGAERGGGGAGIAWGASGLIVTNAHVATHRDVTVVAADGRRARGAVVARDARRDLAVVRASGLELPGAPTGDPARLRPGALVFAVGHPFGVHDAISAGVLQAVGRLPRGFPINGRGAYPWVQADVRLAPGNSGGPLADAAGLVIGVAAMIVGGLALAVPAPDVDALVATVT